MDGHRYADDSERSWYTGSQYARSADSDVSGSHALSATAGGARDSGVHERPSGAFRLPEQRPAAAGYPPPDPLSTTGTHALPAEGGPRPGYESPRIPVRGPEYPTIRPNGGAEPPAPATYGMSVTSEPPPVGEPTSLVPPVGADRFGRSQTGESVYRTRRTRSSFVVAVGMALLLVPVVRLLFQATFAGVPTARDIVPAVLLTLGFVLTGTGLFALDGARPPGREAWLRPPVAYLPVGLVLLLAAGLAAA